MSTSEATSVAVRFDRAGAAPLRNAASLALSAEDVAEAVTAIDATYRRPDCAGVCVADGFGVKVTVERGALQVHDGIGSHRRTRRYDRATHGLRRLVLVQPEGFVTFEALRWCRALNVGVLVLDADGTPTLASTPRVTDDARLRRVQALAPYEPVGLGIARYLLSAKVAGQAHLVLGRFGDPDAACFVPGTRESFEERSATIAELAEAIKGAETIEEARQLEASSAALYFAAWAGRAETAPTFAAKDRGRVPAHWSTFEGRRSVLASSSANRKAERPTNSILNYLFALLEAEAILACAAVGLDPGLGIVHNDARGRQSMALDVMEPVRPEAEAFVLDMLEGRTFRKAEFTETEDGHVRLRAPLTHELAETMPRWARSLAPIAEKVAHMLGHAMEGKYTPATPLTSAKLRSAQAIVKARKTEAVGRSTRHAAKQRPAAPAALPLYSCPRCGGPVTNARHVLCEPCQAGAGHTAAVRQTRGRAIAARKRALKERVWAFGTDVDPAIYRQRIWPKLGAVNLAEIMEATGYSKGHCSTIRAGTWTPHVSTWPALARLVGVSVPELVAR
jgi:CRISPR-associated protein Cas1